MKNMILLIDTNIFLDYLVDREPFAEGSRQILHCCVEKQAKGYIAAHSITNIFYILRKHFSSTERKRMLLELCEFVEICGLHKNQLTTALANDDFDDLEDCVQTECAKSIQADFIITRNVKDFVNSPIPAILPDDFLKMMKST